MLFSYSIENMIPVSSGITCYCGSWCVCVAFFPCILFVSFMPVFKTVFLFLTFCSYTINQSSVVFESEDYLSGFREIFNLFFFFCPLPLFSSFDSFMSEILYYLFSCVKFWVISSGLCFSLLNHFYAMSHLLFSL